MAQPINVYMTGDVYSPVFSKPSLQQWDNYQIYSLVCIDYPFLNTFLETARVGFERISNFTHLEVEYFWYIKNIIPETTSNDPGYPAKYLAYQQYSIAKIPFDFGSLVESLVCPPVDSYEHKSIQTQLIEAWEANEITSPNTFAANVQKYYDYEIQFDADNAANSFSQFSFINKYADYYSAGTVIQYQAYKDTYTLKNPLIPIPSFVDLISGYSRDTRQPATSEPLINLSISGKLKVSYYANNIDEPLSKPPNNILKSIDWLTYEVNIIAGKDIFLPISNCVLGTLILSGNVDLVSEAKNKLEALSISTRYKWNDYFYGSRTQSLFAEWVAIYTSLSTQVIPTGNVKSKNYREYSQLTSRRLAANNNHWNNDNASYSDLNSDISHPMFAIDNQRAYDWHIKPVAEGIGTLVMDSPRTIEIHKALQAQLYLSDDGSTDPTGQHTLDWFIKNSASEKITAIWKALGGDEFAINSIDVNLPKIPTIGYLVKNIARVLGIRVDDNGKIDRAKERSTYQPLTLQNPSYGSSNNNYSLTCWGDLGRVSPYLPNTYKDGKLQTLFDVYADIPQMLEACMRQLNTSLSIQHGSEIRVRGLDRKVQSYPNQLAVSLECLHRLEMINLATQKSLVTCVVVGAEVRELFSAVGVPVTNKYLPLYDSATGRTVQLPYFGHQKNKPSLAGELATVKINLAVQTGMMAPKRSNNIFNPFS